MKILKTIGAIVLWIILSSIAAIIVTKVLAWLSNAFNINTTFGSVIFLILTMPEVMTISFWIVLYIGLILLDLKWQAIIYSIFVGFCQISSVILNPTNITMWCTTIASIVALIMVILNTIGKQIPVEDQENGNS